jgi:HK97 family phage prohead protease
MPYYISDTADCPSWAVIKEGGEVVACHDSKDSAIDQMVALSLAEDIEPGGERSVCEDCDGDCEVCKKEVRAAAGTLRVGDFVSWNSSGGRARGRILEIVTDSVINIPDSDFTVEGTEVDPAALIMVYRQVEGGWEESGVRVGHKFSTLTSIADLEEPEDDDDEDDDSEREIRQVNLTPPAYMRAAARRGLKLYEEGKGGDGLVDRTIREARAMAAGNVSADKWVRIRAWLARHMVDLDSPSASPDHPDYPSAGVVAHLLWGSGGTKRAAQRTMNHAEGVVDRLEEENRTLISVKGKDMARIETRVSSANFEIRESDTGLTFEGYAAVFNSASEPLPFTERIAPGAFRRSLRSRNDIKLLWNHDTGSILGSTRAATLSLTEDNYGLKVRAELPNTSLGRDTAELLRRGDVDSMSFGFSVPAGGDDWSSDGTERTLRSVRLHEVSIVAFPAYSATAGTTSVRALDKIAKRAEVDADMLADAMLKMELGDELTLEESDALSKVINSLSPAGETQEEVEAEPEVNAAMLELKKKKLELLLKGI